MVSLGLVLLAVACGEKEQATPVQATSCSAVVYEGKAQPNVIVVSDLPRGGIAKPTTTDMVEAIKLVLRRRGFRAGEFRVGYQSCNDTVGDEPFDEGLCERNAKAYVAAEDVLGVIGPLNSGCAVLQIPVLSRRAAGPVALVSPAATYTGLTRAAPGTAPGHPASLYPDGLRNYVRVVPFDDAPAAAAAYLARQLGAQRVVTVTQRRDSYGLIHGRSFVEAARGLGLETREFEFRSGARYTALARRVAAVRPQFVYMALVVGLSTRRLLEDLRGALGPSVVFAGADSFLAFARDLGPAAEEMRIVCASFPAELLPPAGKEFLRAFGKSALVTRGCFLGPAEAAQATVVLLDAIGRSDGTRASVVEELFKTRVTNGLLGSFKFDRRGDIDPQHVGIFRIHQGEPVVDRVILVPARAGG